jgi:hypothetical protein
MKNRIRFAITLAGVAFCALSNLAMAQGGPGNSQGDQPAAIEGTWIFKVQVAPGVAFIALQSFTAGGVTVATGTSDRMMPFAPAPTAPISPLYGSWSQKDDNTYVATICFFTFNAAGVATGMFKTNETFRLTGNNTLIGMGVGFSCAPDGSGCGAGQPPIAITGTRVNAQGASN